MTQLIPANRLTWNELSENPLLKNYDKIRLYKQLVEINSDYWIVKDAVLKDKNKDICSLYNVVDGYPFNCPGEIVEVGTEDTIVKSHLIRLMKCAYETNKKKNNKEILCKNLNNDMILLFCISASLRESNEYYVKQNHIGSSINPNMLKSSDIKD